MCAFALAATPVTASPTEIWDCKMHNGERWAVALSSIWGLSLRKGAQAARWEDYKVKGHNAGMVQATGPYGLKGEKGSEPDLVVFDPESGDLTVTAIGSSERRKGKCDLVPMPKPPQP